jgi:carbamoyltransferase
MNVLGISGRYRDAAAAVAVDGQIIAAASEDCFTRVAGIGYTQTGGFPTSAVDACLQAAGLELHDVARLVIVEDEGPDQGIDPQPAKTPGPGKLTCVGIDPLQADAVQAALSVDAADAVLVCSTNPPAMASFVRRNGELTPDGRIGGSERLIRTARTVSLALGAPGEDSLQTLDRLSVGGEPEFQDELREAIVCTPRPAADGAPAIAVDESRLSALMTALADRHPGGLQDAASLNVVVQHTRRALAASFTCRVAEVVRDVADRLRDRGDVGSLAFGGGMFASSRLNTELRRLMGDGLLLAAVPEPTGRALGAALATEASAGRLQQSLALGPAFSDVDIKRTLDNCRLEYVYEPDWGKLRDRVSWMLAQGKVVGWFQGAMGFGPRSAGTRSVLCDPSNRYARHNINEYLRHAPLDEPLPVVFAPSVVSQCLASPVSSPLSVVDAAVTKEWRVQLTAALDWRQHVRVHAASPSQTPELCDLLETHYGRTGVPGLIETNLGGPGEPTACTPRDAVKTVYSSAIDALVMGRFLLMKDYWLLKSHAD